MAELMPPDSIRCRYFFLYDGSKVKGEGDPTREGICYFYPEETPVDRQELLCGQLAGVGRCVSELSSSPVRILRLRRNKFAIRMRDDFFWALGCPVEVPTVSVCELLDQLINLFCFYNGSVRQSYQLNSQETLAARWALYLSHLQAGSSELHHIFSCLRTIDSTNYHSCLASLNGLEAHLRTISPGAPATPGPYIFAHFDCIQSTLTSNLSGRPGGAPEHPFVRAISLLHSHFCNTETLQEAIIRSAGVAIYGTRSVAQETYFLQHGGSLRNSGIPNHQDSAFSLPSKARHRLMKHGVNLL
eukprot:superscaffoldBa00000494_g5164